MMHERIKPKWIDAFTEVFRLCGVQSCECAASLSESRSRPVNVHLAALALLKRGARVFQLALVTPRLRVPVPVRPAGA